MAVRRRVAVTGASSRGENDRQLLQQLRSSFRDRGPEDVPVDVEIGVHQPVSHSNDRGPWQIGQLSARVGGDLICGFSRDLDSADQCKQKHLIRIEIGAPASAGEADRRVQRISKVLQSDPVTRVHTAPRPRVTPRRENSGSNPRRCADPPAVRRARPTALARFLRGPGNSAWLWARTRSAGRYRYPASPPRSKPNRRATTG